MTPTDRTMPEVRATWSDLRRAWLVALPGGTEIAVKFEDEVAPLVARHAPGSAIRFMRMTESEYRLMDGNR